MLICTKTYDAAGAARWLEGLAGPATRVAVLQNGVEHVARFSPYLAPERILPAMVDIPAERSAPGRVWQRREGVIRVPEGKDGADFAALFAHTPLKVSTAADFKSVLWRKLAVNCAGAVNGLVLKPHGISRDPDIAELMRGHRRGMRRGRGAEGAELDEGTADRVVAGYQASPADAVNSLHADRLAGRRTEHDARNGVIVRLGARHGIATPLNALAATLLKAAQ